MKVELAFKRYPCTSFEALKWRNHVWLQLLVLCLSLVHFALTIRYISQISSRIIKLKDRYQRQYTEYRQRRESVTSKGRHEEQLVKISVKNMLYLREGFS